MDKRNDDEAMQQRICKLLISESEPEYRKFSGGLLPGEERLLGVRLPRLRALAKQLLKESRTAYLELELSQPYMEEIMLQGMLIGYLKVTPDLPVERILSYVADYLPKVDNWSLCDSFCTGLKLAKRYPKEVWDFLQKYFGSERDYDVRFALVMSLLYFTDEEHLERLFSLYDEIGERYAKKRGAAGKDAAALGIYYTEMALAWAISMCYVKFPEETITYLRQRRDDRDGLDDFTYNKAIGKITESNRVAGEEKDRIRRMRRKSVRP